MHGLQWD